MKKNFVRVALVACVVCLGLLFAAIVDRDTTVAASGPGEIVVRSEAGQNVLTVSGLGEIYRTSGTISEPAALSFTDSTTRVITWAAGHERFYAISLDGKSISRVTAADHRIMLRYAEFDPLVSAPAVPPILTSRAAATGGEKAYIVQFVTQPLDEYRRQITDAGGQIHIYLPNHAYLVSMNDQTYAAVSMLPAVRWIGRYEPAYKLEEFLLERLGASPARLGPARYNIMAIERGADAQNDIGSMIQQLGGSVDNLIPEGYRMEATLSGDQLLELAHHEKVMFIDRWSAPENDMSIVRSVGGADLLDSLEGYRGQGVRAEVMDNGLRQTHTDFQAGGPPLIHNSSNTSEPSNHGTSTYGINFGRGTTNGAGKGMLPEATGIFADYNFLTNRYTHTARLLQDPYEAVYQSNSWGSSLTTAYTTISAEMDDILFINDFTLLNSQSNAGTQNSRPQAWAKNVVSIGGVRHFNTASLTDDRWQGGASIGPAADGRLKPELAHFYDSVFTTSNPSDVSYTSSFGGTSAATPITAGHFGIFFQMWHERAFANPAGGATVFESRPRMSTAKAVMINTAEQWDMTIPGTDLTRVRQGFGRADLTNLYKLKDGIFIKNETDILSNLESKTYLLGVVSDSSRGPLKVTMVYTDPMGSPGATRARINDLTLKVTAPDGTVYWGNVGLGVGGGMWSTPGGSANIVDTVENVFIDQPAVGTWTIEVIASELVADAHLETPGVIDADFALVVSGPLAPRSRDRLGPWFR